MVREIFHHPIAQIISKICPNLFTGGMNFHGKFEYCSLTTMRKAQQVILNLAVLWSE